MFRSCDAVSDAADPGRAPATTRRCRPDAQAKLRYRVFFVLPDQVEGRCELGQDAPISVDDVDSIERALMDRLGCSNALVIGWQQLGARGVRTATAGERGQRR